MKIKIYQIDKDVDEYDVIFEGYHHTMRTAGKINPDIYRTVYEGDVECETLEEVFALFNGSEQPEHIGHSLTVSDVVEVCDENGNESKGWYFCDVIGWRRFGGF